MTLIDTSAWVEFLRDTGSSTCLQVEQLLANDIATCDVVRMEVLAGARDDTHERSLRRLLAGATHVAVVPQDYDAAALLHRTCRRRGETVRKLLDCVIGAVAIRADLPLLHADADFEVLARHSPLRTVAPAR